MMFNPMSYRGCCLLFTLLLAFRSQGQPTIVSTVPANGAMGVSPTTTVVFTFSTAMNPAATTADFFDSSFTPLNTTAVWSGGNTVLSCTPSPPFPATNIIFWSVDGESAVGDPLDTTSGYFFTGSGTGGSGGTGTNAITSFVLGKIHSYNQTSTALPSLDPDFPYSFIAITSLSSNRSATNVTLTLPTAAVSNLTQNFLHPEDFSLFALYTNLTAFDNTFPSGNYSFNVQATTSNQVVVVNFPPAMQQPGAPHVSNYAAAQTVNPTQPFVLTWDAFPGGAVTDYVYVAIGDSFSSTNVGSPGALNGTATSITIPAGTLQANSNYDSSIGFYRFVSTTNGSSYGTTVYRATVTQFSLVTGSAVSGPLSLTNSAWTPASFSFDVLCSTGQTVTVEYRTNLSIGSWQTLLTTNSPGSRFRATATQSATNRFLFFRARNGP